MRLVQRSAFGLIFGTGVAFASVTAGVACGNKDYADCNVTKTCASSDGSGGSGHVKAAAGAADDDGSVAVSGKGGNAQGGHGGASGQGGPAVPSAHDDGGDGSESVHAGGKAGSSSGENEGGAAPEPVHAAGKGGSAGAPASGGSTSLGGASQGGAAGNAAALGGIGGMAGHGGSDAPKGDVTPPSITAISPQNNATGVKSDAVVSVTFSEPMDTLSAQLAYASTDLPPDSLEPSWNIDNTVLTLHPKTPLAYATLTDPSGAAKHYSFTIASSAKDIAGNALGKDVTVTFSTLRDVTQVLVVPSGGGTVVTEPNSGAVTTTTTCGKPGDYVSAGDTSDNDPILSLVAFDLSSLPAGIVQWNAATLTSSYSTTKTNPFGDSRLGDLHLFSTSVAPSTLLWSSAMSDLGVFGEWASQGGGSLDVTAALESDYTRGGSSEYVFRFDNETDDNDAGCYAELYCSDLRLTTDYLVP